jgi:hypothetical protein
MSNIRKTFNFRDGVQVDDDDLVVRGGQVGIGSTVPTERLDVNGNIRSVGLVTSRNLFVTGISTTTELRVGNNISASASSGIITATAFYGNGATLSNLPTSQWVDIDVGLGFTSIYAAGNVGIATTDPRSTFQVGANPNASGRGVGFNSTGDIRASGVVTAYAFAGFGTNITNLNADNITNGTILNTVLPTIDNAKLPANISVSGIITATGGFIGSVTGNVTGNVTGTAQSASSLTGTPNINVGVITATRIVTDTIEVIQSPIGVTTIANTLNVGTGGTGFTATGAGLIGVGTANPTSEIQVRKDGTTTVEVLSNTGEARISIGQSVGVGKSTGLLRFGNTPKTFDIINNDTGNINLYLHAGPSGINTGRFDWVYGQTNTELMSLTYGGFLGIGITNPDETLHVVGTSTVTSNAYFGSNVAIAGNLTAGSITLPSILTNTNLSNTSGVSTVANLLVAPVGVGSIGINTTNAIAGLDARAVDGLFNRIGVNTTVLGNELLTVDGAAKFSSIGIGTSASSTGIGLILVNEFVQRNSTSYYYDSIIYVSGQSGVGVGTTAARSAVDFADAGKTNAGLLPGEGTGSRAYFLPPRLTTTQRIGLATEAGAIIYNTSTSRHQGYNGTSWNDLY